MSLELTCKLKQLLQEQTGNGKNGPWVKQDFLVETLGEYPKTICMSAWGDQVKMIQGVALGSILNTALRIESREYNGRWYTDVRPWKLTVEGGTQTPTAGASSSYAASAPVPAGSMLAENENDDLPF